MKAFGQRSGAPAGGAARAGSEARRPGANPAAPRGPALLAARPDAAASVARAKEALRATVFKDLLDAMNLSELANMDPVKARVEVGEVVRALIGQQNTSLTLDEQESVAVELVNDVLGLGPLEVLLARDDIADIMVCGPSKVYIEVGGRLQLTDIKFRDEAQLINICRKIVGAVGRRVDESSPICDARLADGSRVAIVAPPLAVDGTSLTIRKFKKDKLGLQDLVKFGSISPAGARVLEIASTCRCNILVSGGTGSGKSLTTDALLRTPTGWKRMGDARVGDVLLAPDGTATRVTGVYPQGVLPAFRVRFQDGRSTVCSADHLWKVWTRASRWCPEKKKKTRDMGWRVAATQEMARWLESGRSAWSRTAVPVVEAMAMHLPPRDLPVPPYVLGALIGDGSTCSGPVYGFTSADPEVVERMDSGLRESGMKLMPKGDRAIEYRLAMLERRKVNPFRKAIEALGLHGVGASDKFIPDDYKQGSVEQRLELMRGLMDTDGTVDKRGIVSFSTSSERLAFDVREIMWSLGAIASITTKRSFYEHKGERREGKPCHRVWIKMPGASTLFTLPRKLERCNDRPRGMRLKVVGIEPCGEATMQCISVDHPEKLYVTDNYVVTHNTTLLNCLTRFINPGEATITCEDACELQLQQSNVRRWETRPPNLEGAGEITMSALVKAALRHRPERIIIGEVRGKEAFDLLQAMNTGHDGSMGTVHSNSPREAIGRVESMIAMGGWNLSARTVREQIASSIDIIVQASRLRDGSRKITHISEVAGMEGDAVTLQDLVLFEQTGEDAEGRILGRHRSTGMRPHFIEKARGYGLERDLMAAIQDSL